MGVANPEIIGREAELAAIRAFLDGGPPPRALLLEGGAGIGKTTLWEAGVAEAGRRGLRVLVARPSGAEARLAFGALTDLLDRVELGTLSGLPSPQLRALEVAVMRAEPGDAPVQPGSIALGFLNALRAMASAAPLLVAIDDLQWLDRPSADTLAYVADRLRGERVTFLLARRPGRVSGLERALDLRSERLEVDALSLGATRKLLATRLELRLPRPLLRRVVDLTGGNPLFALEVGRAVVERGTGPGEEPPVPDRVEDLLGTRVRRLPAPTRRLLLAVALSADPTVSQLAEIGGDAAVETAIDSGVLVSDGDRVRASHPLLAAVSRERSSARARRELHLRLSRAVADEELRARHLALSATRPDAALGARLATAAAAATARGARQEAVELADHALRLTPPGSALRGERRLVLAECLVLAGDPERATELLARDVEALPAGAVRARGWIVLAGGVVRGAEEVDRYLELALEESRCDPALHARVALQRVQHTAVVRVERIPETEDWAREALDAARRAGAAAERSGLYGLSWASALRGKSVEHLCERFRAVSHAGTAVTQSPERVAGQRHTWRGETDRARAILERLLSVADERDEPYSYALLRLHLCELELRVGAWDAAEHLLEEWAEDREILVWPMFERCRALLGAGRGLRADAEQWASAAMRRATETGSRWDELEASRASGIAALLAHDPLRAAEALRPVWRHGEREGVLDPGVFPVAPDLVEALAELGELDEARAVTDRLRLLAEAQAHPWGRATATRCEALVRLGLQPEEEAAAAGLEDAADAYAGLGLRFDHARTLLLLGRAQRRRRKRAAARRALEESAAAFEELGAPGWLGEARSELARVGGRPPQPTGGLTPAERRAAELAVEGLSNKEIAHALFVTVNTVETHLSHAYAKLGIRSRAQLAGALSRL